MIVFVEVGERSINMGQIATVKTIYTTKGRFATVELAVASSNTDGFMPVIPLHKEEGRAFDKFWRGDAKFGDDYTVRHLCTQITKIHLRLPVAKGGPSDE